jgi:DNA-binding beta-propeller fold protein YncE
MFPVAVAVDPSGRWLYSANTNSAEVGLFSIGNSGALAALNPARVPIGTANVNNPSGIAVDPSGHYVYVSDSVDPIGMVWQFTIGTTGTLTPMTPPSVAAGVVPQFIAIAAHYQ